MKINEDAPGRLTRNLADGIAGRRRRRQRNVMNQRRPDTRTPQVRTPPLPAPHLQIQSALFSRKWNHFPPFIRLEAVRPITRCPDVRWIKVAPCRRSSAPCWTNTSNFERKAISVNDHNNARTVTVDNSICSLCSRKRAYKRRFRKETSFKQSTVK